LTASQHIDFRRTSQIYVLAVNCPFLVRQTGVNGISPNRLSHIAELDLTDNLIAEWSEVFLLLKMFPSLEFLNLSNNLLSEPVGDDAAAMGSTALGMLRKPLQMRKLVLNGNRVDWSTANKLAGAMPNLEQLYLCANGLQDPVEGLGLAHDNLRELFLSCNVLSDFGALVCSVGAKCPKLELLSAAENPMDGVPDGSQTESSLARVRSLNLSPTSVSTWEEVDRLRSLPSLRELRLQHCPVLSGYSAHERRMLLVARLPNVRILNGGDIIPENEREDAERAFIRFYMEMAEDERPPRYEELVRAHGRLEPLVKIDMRPSTHVKVKISYKEALREEVIKVYQTVQQFKGLLQQWFGLPPQNMKLYYCDKVIILILIQSLEVNGDYLRTWWKWPAPRR